MCVCGGNDTVASSPPVSKSNPSVGPSSSSSSAPPSQNQSPPDGQASVAPQTADVDPSSSAPPSPKKSTPSASGKWKNESLYLVGQVYHPKRTLSGFANQMKDENYHSGTAYILNDNVRDHATVGYKGGNGNCYGFARQYNTYNSPADKAPRSFGVATGPSGGKASGFKGWQPDNMEEGKEKMKEHFQEFVDARKKYGYKTVVYSASETKTGILGTGRLKVHEDAISFFQEELQKLVKKSYLLLFDWTLDDRTEEEAEEAWKELMALLQEDDVDIDDIPDIPSTIEDAAKPPFARFGPLVWVENELKAGKDDLKVLATRIPFSAVEEAMKKQRRKQEANNGDEQV